MRCRGRDISLLRRDVTEAEKRNHADFYDFCPVISTFSDHCLFRNSLDASHAHNTRQPVIHSEQRADEKKASSFCAALWCAAVPGRARPKAAGPRREPHPAVRTRGFPSWVRIRARARARVRIGAKVRG